MNLFTQKLIADICDADLRVRSRVARKYSLVIRVQDLQKLLREEKRADESERE
ncbi:hypothetical protein DNHGIG_14850 [Collibacillus ludicampi]|uniref:Uncharacterized protein n=2 Tax=Collibacillus ludicampi TaxID=2771369 RepID=A0AAV4LDQ8_9BACL|nr:hypothetical protein DNHGIG_14850 [Collibacillus ludicampi]